MFLRKRRVSEIPPHPLLVTEQPVDFPDGLAIETADASYLIKNGKRYRFFSTRCRESWSLETIQAAPEAVSGFKHGGVLGFRDGSLIMNFADGKIYLISQSKRRQVMSRDALVRYGLDSRGITEVSDDEANIHEDGEPIR